MFGHLFNPLILSQLLVAAFLAILFLQSGIDKVVDRRGNFEWLVSHFAKSPLASMVAPMLLIMTIAELAAGILSAVGFVQIFVTGHSTIAFIGAGVAAGALTALFFGQRVAKDYAGAATLVSYFLLALAAIWILGSP